MPKIRSRLSILASCFLTSRFALFSILYSLFSILYSLFSIPTKTKKRKPNQRFAPLFSVIDALTMHQH
ncbi:hypothetical protein VSF3289_00952 [Vibrio scophthalmi]|uniref:Uncharacterized protein n=1 Tax=Vibrio scophthalmi TaxID=45658 RepID=A0A1E3WNX6_9VIBR|nr:hypothetical protein VSF3289_00952 [Vibrio scophthalmi]